MTAARQWTDVIMTDPQTPAGTRSRASVIERTYRGERQGLRRCRDVGSCRCFVSVRRLRSCWCSRAAPKAASSIRRTIFNNDVFDTKKKLKGDREAVFPDGVPGTTTGVPADLVKGYQPPPDQDADATTRARQPRRQPPAKVAAGAKTQAETEAEGRGLAAPANGRIRCWSQKPAASGRHGSASDLASAPAAPASRIAGPVWPTPRQTAPAQQTAQPSQSIWPNPPAPGKLSPVGTWLRRRPSAVRRPSPSNCVALFSPGQRIRSRRLRLE